MADIYQLEQNMPEEHVSLYHFDFSVVYLGAPEIGSSTIKVPISNLLIIGGYPGYPEDTLYGECVLIYINVISSERKVFEYATPERKGFKSKYSITDGPFDSANGEVFLFYIEGVSKELNAWMSWEIVATSVQIEETEPPRVRQRS